MVNSYLRPTAIIDVEAIRPVARALGLPAPAEGAIAERLDDQDKYALVARIYEIVLPLPYRFGRRDRTASQTWALGRGTCYNKTHLFIALCRSVGVPAGYRMFKYHKGAYAAALGADHPLYLAIDEATRHVLPVVWVGGRFIDVDCCDDPTYARAIHGYDPPARWEGQDICNVDPEHVIAELGRWADLDTLLRRPSRFSQDDYDVMNARVEARIAASAARDVSDHNTR